MGKYASGRRRFFKRNLAKVYAQPAAESLRRPALSVWQCEVRILSLLKASVPRLEPIGVVKSALNSASIAETRNPFHLRISVPRGGGQTETGRILQDHFHVFLISICIHSDGKLDRTILTVNFRFLSGEIVSTPWQIEGICEELWRNKVISFLEVVVALICVHTQMRSAISHGKNDRSLKADISTLSIVNRWNTTALSEGVSDLFLQQIRAGRLSVYEVLPYVSQTHIALEHQ